VQWSAMVESSRYSAVRSLSNALNRGSAAPIACMVLAQPRETWPVRPPGY
jgi:hypothetical protein